MTRRTGPADGCHVCREICPRLTAPGTSGRSWLCEHCGTVWPGRTLADWLAMDDSPARRLALGHINEPDVPGYCTCGDITTRCTTNPRTWLTSIDARRRYVYVSRALPRTHPN
jgi:hypothetical protein